MIMEIFSVLGPLKAFHFEINNDLNEPCVFLEYSDESVTQKACAALNGMKLGGRILTVAQAIPDTSFKENMETLPFYGIPEHVKPLLEKPTLVLKLSNVLDQKAIELIPATDLEEIMEDVRLECSRFGIVVSINVVTTNVIMQTTDIKVKAVIDGGPPFQPHGEREHDEGEGHDDQPLTNVEKLNTADTVEGDEHDVTTGSSTEVEASRMSTLDVKEADTSTLHECEDSTSNVHHHQSIGVDDSTIENIGNHEEAVEEDRGIVKVNDTEICEADAVEQLDKAADKQPEVSSVSSDDASTRQVENSFEIGCILVEFKRTEASCMAAHCLHGRLFDDRTVTVGYVSHEAYLARFPK